MKWQSETFDVIKVIFVQSVVVLNMNTEVFRIHGMNILYKISDLKYIGKYYVSVRQVWLWAELASTKVADLALTDCFQISRDSSF